MELKKPRILFLDIEASDLQADIGHIISIGWKWNHEKHPKVISLLDYPGKASNDDSNLLKAFESVWNQADLVVHHFGDFYDIPFIQTRRLIHGLAALPTVATVDTWRIAKKKLRFGSNRLQRILEVLRCPYDKSPVKLSIWSDARVGIKTAFKYIVEHNRLDVLVLEWVYNKLRGVWPSHPQLYKDVCPICGSKSLRSEGTRITSKKTYRRLWCKDCGGSFKGEVI